MKLACFSTLAGLFLASLCPASDSEWDLAEMRGKALLSKIATNQPEHLCEDARIIGIRQVAQSSRQIYSTGLKPVWHANFMTKENARGYLAWDVAQPGRLVEFAVDVPQPAFNTHCLSGVPNLQQFSVSGKNTPQVASGCVPTAGADLIGYWILKGFRSGRAVLAR